MRKQTFIDNMTERGYELRNVRNGNVIALTDENATDEETMRIIDVLTA